MLEEIMKYYIQTLGCAMNYSDSERVSAVLEKIGYMPAEKPEETDLYIFNTCSIRQKGEDRVYGQLKNVSEWKKKNPRLLIGITGCMARKTSSRNTERDYKDDLLKQLKELDFVFNIKETHKLAQVLEEAEPQLEIPELEEAQLEDYLKLSPKYSSPFQAYVPIQIGCDKYCTYCIVPYARGREQSRNFKEIIAECKKLVENGCKEITLVGQTVNSYGKSALDKKNKKFTGFKEDPFVALLKEIDKLSEKGLNRLRFTSPHPRDFSDELIQAHATLKTLCPAIHLPVQAGHDETLKRMNRQYTVKQYKDLAKKIRKAVSGCSLTTDIIVGFPRETDEEFQGTYNLYKEIKWDMAFLARYSPRKGTTAVSVWGDDVQRSIKAKRWHTLNDLLEKCAQKYHNSLKGRVLEVLVESFNEKTKECEGKCRENKVIQFPGTKDLIGKIVKVEIIKGCAWLAKGRIIKK
jgi:tRNA-2-methylthio-N6-dimethylallyladenosine synthase